MQIISKLRFVQMTLVIGIIFFVCNVPLWAAHTDPHVKSRLERVEVNPIPTLRVLTTGATYTSDYTDPIIKEKNLNVAVRAVSAAAIEGVEYYIADMEADLLSIEEGYRSAEAKLAAALIEDPDYASYMKTIAEGQYSAKAKKVKSIISGAIDAGRFIDQLTGGDLVSMPIVKQQPLGDNTTINIVFDKARIYPTYTELDVYIGVTFNQMNYGDPTLPGAAPEVVELLFAAKDIKFSQEKGIIEGVVGLVNDYSFKLGSSGEAGIVLRGLSEPSEGNYQGTYVAFNCDGFKEIGIGGDLIFSRSWVLPTNEFGVPLPGSATDPKPRVKLEIGVIAQSLEDIMVSVDIDNFVLTKFQDVSFELSNATLDLSGFRNPEGIPSDYAIALNPEWEGVHIESASITLPEPFKRNCSSFVNDPNNSNNPDVKPTTCRIKVSGKDIIIDQYGLTGGVSIKGQAPLLGGPIMDGEWGWSMDELTLFFGNSNVTEFSFAGDIGVPILSKDGPLGYEAELDFGNNEYNFLVASNEDYKKSFPIWKAAEVNLTSAALDIAVADGEFHAGVTMSGSLTLGDPDDKINGGGGSMLKMPKIIFTDLKLNSRSPKFSVLDIGLATTDATGNETTSEVGQSKVANFPVSISGFSVGSSAINPNILNLGFTMNVNLMDGGSPVAASGDFELVGELGRNQNGSRTYEYKEFNFTGAEVTLNLPQFYAKGDLNIFTDDDIYGKGFSAKLEAKILGKKLETNKGKFNLKMAAIFGSSVSDKDNIPDDEDDVDALKDNFRYFMVDGMLESDKIKIPLFGPFYLNGFGGGASNRMRPSGFNDPSASSAISQMGESTTGIVFKPHAETGLGLKFNASLSTVGNTMSGVLTAMLRFSPTGSLQNITFWGAVDIMLDSDLDDQLVKKLDDAVAGSTSSLTKLIQTEEDIKKEAEEDAKIEVDASGQKNAIKGSLGLSFDFEDGFTFHGFAKVNMRVGEILTGSGTLDLLLDTGGDEESGNTGTDWHLYIGGYYENGNGQDVIVNDFFNPDQKVILRPVSVLAEYHNIIAHAEAYFLTGNTIPGPPPQPAKVEDFFGPEIAEVDNRASLKCDGRDNAMGTGIAFGASAELTADVAFPGIFGSCVAGLTVNTTGVIGFDLSLLKYSSTDGCSMTDNYSPPMGLKGYRATGRAYGFLRISDDSQLTCIPLPKLGIGGKVRFDVFNPSFLDLRVVFELFDNRVTVPVAIGDECGQPCALEAVFND